MGAEHLAAYRAKQEKKKSKRQQSKGRPYGLANYHGKKTVNKRNHDIQKHEKRKPVDIDWVINELTDLKKELEGKKKTESLRNKVMATMISAMNSKAKYSATAPTKDIDFDMEKFKNHAKASTEPDSPIEEE